MGQRSRQSEIDQLKAEFAELVSLVEGDFDTTTELSCMVLALIKERDQLKAEKAGLETTIKGVQKFLADHADDGLIEGCMADDINEIIKDGEYVEKALRGGHE